MANNVTLIKAEGTGLLMQKLTGQYPRIVYHDDYAEIILDPVHRNYVELQVDKALTPGKEKGDLVFTGLGSAVTRPVLKKALPWLFGIFAVGYITGKIL